LASRSEQSFYRATNHKTAKHGVSQMIKAIIENHPTIDALFDSDRMYMVLSNNVAVLSYVYLDGQCVGTMWVEVTDDTGCGYFETCFDSYYKCPKRLENLVGPSNWGDAEDSLATYVLNAAKDNGLLKQED
jgi:hypothetical protein